MDHLPANRMFPSRHPRGRDRALSWRQSMVVRLALVVCVILTLGFASNVLIGIQSINTLARLIHDEDIDAALDGHLQHIKEVHALRQQLLVERLRPHVEAWQRGREGGHLDRATLEGWLRDVGQAPLFGPLDASSISPAEAPSTAGIGVASELLGWLDKETLAIGGWTVRFSRGPLFRAFNDVSDLRQRYHLLGTELSEQIRPTLIKANALVLLAGYLILALTFFIVAKKLARHLQEILVGIEHWRRSDFKFRFKRNFPGELGIIARQFNAMARDIDINRQRTLYLEKVASWQVIARKLAHEIKNPLTPIQMMVSQLARLYKGSDPQFKDLLEKAQRIITEEVNGLRHLVDHFSHFALLPEPKPADADLVGVITHVLEMQRAAFPQHDIAYRGELREVRAFIDESLMRQVFANLIKNAAEASPDRPASILVSVTETRRAVIAHVEDHGPGIPKDMTARIFEAYFTTKHTSPAPGMGLGLAICQKIVLDHHGELDVVSRPGKTVFRIKLPKTDPDLA